MLPFYFAHHFLCDNYRSEVIELNSWYFCRGCVLVYSSAIISFSINVVFNPFGNYSLSEVFFIVLVISSPTWLGFMLPFENRKWKDLLRISMGLGWGIALAEIWLQPLWGDKVIIILIMTVFLIFFQKLRNFQTSRRISVLCGNCNELNDNACEGFKNQFEAERLYSRELSDFLQKRLTWNNIQEELK